MKAVAAAERGGLAVVDAGLDPPRSGASRVGAAAAGTRRSALP